MSKKKSGKEKILNHLKNHGSITPMTAWMQYGVYRLGARILELRKQGYKILTDMQTKVNDEGRKVYFAKYYLK